MQSKLVRAFDSIKFSHSGVNKIRAWDFYFLDNFIFQ